MDTLFPPRYGLGMPISFQADGSLDRGLNDKHAMLLSFVGVRGLKETCMLDLRELDMTQSKDGRSPDAAATTGPGRGAPTQARKGPGRPG